MEPSQTPFDEKAALEELERLRDAIQAARRARMAKSDEFDQFVNGFKEPSSPPPAAREPEPEPEATAPVIELPTPSPMPELLTLTPAPEPAAQMFERLTRMLEPPAQGSSQPTEMSEPLTQTSPLPPPTGTASKVPAVDVEKPRAARQPRRYPANQIIGAVAVAAVGLIAVGMYFSRGPSTRVAEAPASAVQSTPAPAQTPPAPSPTSAPPAPVAAVNVELRTLQPVWMRVTVDGEKQREGTVPAGERLQLHADREIVIRAGNGGDVMVKTANGETPLGVAGQPITFTFTKAAGKS